MLFHSIEFIIFLPAVVLAYFLFPPRLRWVLLLGASYYFYACWRVEYLALIVVSTLADYAIALLMAKEEDDKKRRLYLYGSLLVNLSLLGYFKYGMLFAQTAQDAFNVFSIAYEFPRYDILLPVGISFYTFQTLSYTIDVYWRKREPEKHLGYFALYVTFFPQLVAGPIERSTKLLPQFREMHRFNWAMFQSGLLLIIWGFFKKLVVGDRLAIYQTAIFADPGAYNGLQVFLAPYALIYQIYCDFSGYTDVAIGSAMLMGYQLSQNFNRPFAAKSFREFWQRWHMTLTRWIIDYVYLPLARGTKKGWQRDRVSIFAFFLIGLWHGAAWHFAAFGLFQGISMALSAPFRGFRKFFYNGFIAFWTLILRHEKSSKFVTEIFAKLWIMFMFAASAVFFGAHTIPDAFLIYGKALTLNLSKESIMSVIDFPMLYKIEWVILFVSIVIIEVGQWLHVKKPWGERLEAKPIWFRWPAYYALIFGLLLFGRLGQTPHFYFQF